MRRTLTDREINVDIATIVNIIVGISFIAIVVLFRESGTALTKVMSVEVETEKLWKRTKELIKENKKLKGIVAELCDYVYKD